MNIAITVWENRISPVFDSSQTLLLVSVEGSRVEERRLFSFSAGLFPQLLAFLKKMEVEILICGALCRGPVRTLEAVGIEVWPFMTGEVETILQLFVQGDDLSGFFMPGCGDIRCCRTRVDRQSLA